MPELDDDPIAEANAPKPPTMRAALEAVLMFHAGGPWGAGRAAQWRGLTGIADATSRDLCDAVRAALGGANPRDAMLNTVRDALDAAACQFDRDEHDHGQRDTEFWSAKSDIDHALEVLGGEAEPLPTLNVFVLMRDDDGHIDTGSVDEDAAKAAGRIQPGEAVHRARLTITGPRYTMQPVAVDAD